MKKDVFWFEISMHEIEFSQTLKGIYDISNDFQGLTLW